jgi:hypothetical protein
MVIHLTIQNMKIINKCVVQGLPDVKIKTEIEEL